MNRNMMRRIEIAWPVLDVNLRQRIIDECLVAYLHDSADAWLLNSDESYQRQPFAETSKGLSVQTELMKRYRKAS
jgi:polyphosphate kinase